MKRKIEQWKLCSPQAMAYNQSDAAKFYAFQDARADILELDGENQRLRDILRQIAYPKRGSVEASMNVQDFADAIQAIYTAEQLEGER